MKIGIIGAGFVGRAIAELAIARGHDVMLANSRGPQTLFSLRGLLGSEIGTIAEAIAFGEVVIVAVPLGAIGTLPADQLAGKRVIDAANYYPVRDGHIPELDTGATTTSEMLARVLPGARITKAFNAIPMPQLLSDGTPAGTPGRRALPLAGDFEADKALVAGLYEAFGFDAVDVGGLTEGWRFERDMPSYCVPMDRPTLVATLARAARHTAA